MLQKEWLKRLDFRFRRSDQAILSRAENGKFPGRNIVGKFEIDSGTALFIRLD